MLKNNHLAHSKSSNIQQKKNQKHQWIKSKHIFNVRNKYTAPVKLALFQSLESA